DHINARCKWAGPNKIGCMEIVNGKDDCGIGVYYTELDKYLWWIGNHKRINTCNSIKWDPSEVANVNLSLQKWAYTSGFDINELGDAVFAYGYINLESIEPIGFPGMATRLLTNTVRINSYVANGCGPLGEVIKPIGTSILWNAYEYMSWMNKTEMWISAGDYEVGILDFPYDIDVNLKIGSICTGAPSANWNCPNGVCEIKNGSLTISSGTLVIQ
ncbi:unnamed protein product, partial [marine sediment metagenome]